MYNLNDVILYQQQDLDVAAGRHVELGSAFLLLTPRTVNERVANDDITLVVARIDVNCSVTLTVIVTSAEVDRKPVYTRRHRKQLVRYESNQTS